MPDKKSDFNKVKVGDKWSMAAYGVVTGVGGNKMHVLADDGTDFTVHGESLVEAQFQFQNQYDEVKNVTKTEMQEVFKAHARVVMTVTFRKQINAKTIEQQIKAAIDEGRFKLTGGRKTGLTTLSKEIAAGEARTMVGRHYGQVDNAGRVKFVDMEAERDQTKDYDTRTRQVDPRTIEELIAAGTKYVLK